MITVAGGLASLAFALLATSNAPDVHVISDTSCMCRLISWELDQLSPPSTGVPVPSTSGELHTDAQRLNANTCVVVAHPMHKAPCHQFQCLYVYVPVSTISFTLLPISNGICSRLKRYREFCTSSNVSQLMQLPL